MNVSSAGRNEIMNWSHIAGLFDGEGTARKDDDGYPWIAIQLYGSKGREVLEAIWEFIGRKGNIFVRGISETQRKARNEGKEVEDNWSLILRAHADASWFLENVVNDLILKKAEVQQLIDYINSKKWRRGKT